MRSLSEIHSITKEEMQWFVDQLNSILSVSVVWLPSFLSGYRISKSTHSFTNVTGLLALFPPYSFNISIEVLATAIRERSSIKRVQIGRIEHNLILYADDIVFLLGNPARSLTLVKEPLTEYGKV